MSEPTTPASTRPTCPRHPDRESRLRCQRCGRPTCPECQRPAPVGFHCVDCVAQAARNTPTSRTVFGGPATDGRPVVTYTLIGLCVAVYALQLFDPVVSQLGQFAPLLAASQPWRFVTSAFLHDPTSPMHILFNMLCLWQIGQWLEPLLGRARFAATYLVGAIGGSVGALCFASPPQNPLELGTSGWVTPVVGASGAVFALFAVVLVLLRHLGRSASGIVVLLLINAAMPFVFPRIAWQAHVGGFVTGLALAGVIVATRSGPRRRYQWPGIGLVFVVLVGIAVVRYAIADTGFVDSYAPFG